MNEDYWRHKFDALTLDTTAQTIRSLRSQLRTVKRLARDAGHDRDQMLEALRSIEAHAGIGLEIETRTDPAPAVVVDGDDESLFVSEGAYL